MDAKKLVCKKTIVLKQPIPQRNPRRTKVPYMPLSITMQFMEYIITQYPEMPSIDYKKLKLTVLKASQELLQEFAEDEIAKEMVWVVLHVFFHERNIPTNIIDNWINTHP